MLAEAKLALRVTAAEYDLDIARLLMAGALDLKIAGVILPGTVQITATVSTEGDVTVTDLSTLEDPLCMQALFTYARAHFGSPPDYDRLEESYQLQKVQLMHATGYTDYPEEESDEDDSEGGEGEPDGTETGGQGEPDGETEPEGGDEP